jgi:AcrR family transcriptional regulator
MPPRPRTVPRKAAKQERSRATVEAILTATARVLVKEGFDRASTNRIAEQAGVSIGSLYQYFPSKEALVAALIERHVDEMWAVIEPALSRLATAPFPVAARELVGIMLQAHAVDPELHKVLIEQVPRVGRLEHVHDVEARATVLVRAYLDEHRQEIRACNLGLAAFVMVQAVEALTHAVTTHHPTQLAEAQLLDEITTLLVRYLS